MHKTKEDTFELNMKEETPDCDGAWCCVLAVDAVPINTTAVSTPHKLIVRGDSSITSTCFACWPTTRGDASRRLVRKTWEMAAA